jgi:CheY-like chemotaxis protein
MADARKKILHADDVARWRQYVKSLLAEEYDVVSCQDCETVVASLRQGGFDLVILDVLMPGAEPLGSGFDVCLHLRKTYPTLPVIVFTGAWAGVDVNREELMAKTRCPVVFKEALDPELDDLPARVRELAP